MGRSVAASARRSAPRRHGRVAGVPLLDVALATVLLLASVGGILTGEVDEGPVAVTLPVAVVTALAVVLRTRAPLAAVGVVCAGHLVQTAVAGASPGTVMALVLVLVLAYSTGAYLEEGLAAVGLATLLSTSFVEEWLDHGSDYAFLTIELGGAWLLGRAARGLRERATQAEEHQRDLARLAVAEERTRIARELHDVVAHSLSVIAVQADAAEAALARQPDRADAPLRAIRASAREALSDMRQLLYLLREDHPEDGDDVRHPARGLDDLPALLDRLRAAGLPVQAELGDVPQLGAGAGLAAYRIVQEALTNVRKHAGAVPTCVRVVPEGGWLRLEVRNAAADEPPADPPSTGHGLAGARERAHAAGGSLRTVVLPDGGFELVALLPLPAADRTSPGART